MENQFQWRTSYLHSVTFNDIEGYVPVYGRFTLSVNDATYHQPWMLVQMYTSAWLFHSIYIGL